ncbi:uncharacterized protein [Dysidea avara]|uniref:uncharacterized protein isoform X2 n=1 Tax=Dysidea avara TaxID=196820 RepID=UPI0033172808
MMPNDENFDLKLNKNKKATMVVHGKITVIKEQTIKIKFSKSTILPMTLESSNISKKYCNLEIIPFQVTFRHIDNMFQKLAGLQQGLSTVQQELLEEICCRKYSTPIEIPDVTENEGGDDGLNEGQREAALIAENRLLLIQGPPVEQ